MTYELEFHPKAWKEWNKLDPDTRAQFGKKLKERLDDPKVLAARLHGMSDCYKIKLRTRGYRLVYQVREEIVTVLVLSVGRRQSNEVYEAADVRQ